MVNVLPDPVTPRSVACAAALKSLISASIACG